MTEDKKTIRKTDYEMSAEIKAMQKELLIGKIMLFVGFAAIAVSMFMRIFPAVAVFFVIAVAGSRIVKKSGSRIKQIASDNILRQVLERFFDNVDYHPSDWLSQWDIDSAGFRFSYDDIRGGDLLLADYNGRKVGMSGINLISVSSDSDGNTVESFVFRGLWLICKTDKEIPADVCIRTRSKIGKIISHGGIKTENEEFDRQFHVRSNDESEALKILTPSRMEYLIQMSKNTKTQINISFLRDGTMHIALNTGRDAFRVRASLSDAEKIREQYTQEIRQITDIVDKLGVILCK